MQGESPCALLCSERPPHEYDTYGALITIAVIDPAKVVPLILSKSIFVVGSFRGRCRLLSWSLSRSIIVIVDRCSRCVVGNEASPRGQPRRESTTKGGRARREPTTKGSRPRREPSTKGSRPRREVDHEGKSTTKGSRPRRSRPRDDRPRPRRSTRRVTVSPRSWAPLRQCEVLPTIPLGTAIANRSS